MMLRSPFRVVSLAAVLFFALSAIALPVQSPQGTSISPASSHIKTVHSMLKAVHGVTAQSPILAAIFDGPLRVVRANAKKSVVTHNTTSISKSHLKERGIVSAIVDVGKGLVSLISKIVEKVKAKRREKKARTAFTKNVVEQGRQDHPEFKWVVTSTKHHVSFKGTQGTDWDHEEKDCQVNGKSIKYDVYYAREGEFWNDGAKGFVNWAYDGSYDIDAKSKGKHIVFKRPPGK